MTELVPLLRGEADELELRLLSSAQSDAPSPEARARTLAALGAAGAVAGTAAALHAGTSAASGGAATTGAAAAGTGAAATAGGATAKLGAALIVKWVGIGVLAGTVTSVGANAVTTAPSRSTLASDSMVEAPAQPAALPTTATPKAAFAATAEPEVAASAVPAPAASAALEEEAPAHDVAAEVALLDRARKAVSQGDSAAALAALQQHESEFKNGSLGPEAEVLRIEALLRRGDGKAAAQAARAFLAGHGESPHVARVRKLLGKAEAQPAAAPRGATAPAPAAEPEPEAPAAPVPAAPATASFPDP